MKGTNLTRVGKKSRCKIQEKEMSTPSSISLLSEATVTVKQTKVISDDLSKTGFDRPVKETTQKTHWDSGMEAQYCTDGGVTSCYWEQLASSCHWR
jgi:hypothetical protein